MIVRIFCSGTSNGESPVNYLLSDKDHAGDRRAVKPEVIEGHPQTTIDVINSIQRKHKYISGCMSFRDSEKPTKEQLFDLIDDFKKTFCPALKGDNFNSLFVLHQDKGNTELHFVIPSQELKSGRRLNIHPPGQRNISFFEAFTKVTNQKMGYAQVVPNPLKMAFTEFERKTSEGRKDRSNKGYIHKSIIDAIKSGEVKNRADLCRHLDENLSVTTTRMGKDYLSVKFPGSLKAKRLRGSLYAEGIDYQSLIKQSAESRKPQFLSSTDFKSEQTKLSNFVHEREQFNIKAYLTPRPIRRLAGHQTSSSKAAVHQIMHTPSVTLTNTTITTRSPNMGKMEKFSMAKKIIQDALAVARNKLPTPTPTNGNLSKDKISKNIMAFKNQPLGASQPQIVSNEAIMLTIGEVETSLQEALVGITNAKSPQETEKIKQRIIQLRLQLEKLYAQLEFQKKQISARKLKW